ncbi:hypothetical protein HAX54_004144 [Datura stramonium]|uniref:Uncharacterized protein n=1 Tax=Datura stramonium TaxID=4076 RepID=A0ABS8WUT1_DATST|nr:hypothetical protein [Datura stramonium]
MERTYGRTVRVVVRTNSPSFVPVGYTGKSPKPRKLLQLLPHLLSFDEGSDEAEFDGDNPPTNNAEKENGNAEEGNDDTEESGDNGTEAEESAAEQSNEQVGYSDPATTPEVRSKRWFL